MIVATLKSENKKPNQPESPGEREQIWKEEQNGNRKTIRVKGVMEVETST